MQPNSEWQLATQRRPHRFKKACAWRIGESLSEMARLRLTIVALALCCCCLIHAPATTGSAAADASFPPGLLVVQQDTRVTPPSSLCGAGDQAAVAAGEAEAAGGRGRMDVELEDYPGSGANDRHSPWAQQRRN